MRIKIISEDVTKIKTDLLLAGFFENAKPIKGAAGEIDWLYNGALSRLILSEKACGRLGETVMLATGNRLHMPKVIFLGLGEEKRFTYSTINTLSKTVFDLIKSLLIKDIVIDFIGMEGVDLDNSQSSEAFLSGLPKGLKEDEETALCTITLLVNEKDKARELNRNIKILSKF